MKNEFWRSQSKWCTADNVYCKPGPKSIIANCSITGGEAAGNGGQRLFKIQSNSARNHCENRMLQSGGVLRISGKNQNHPLSKRGGANNLNRDYTRWKSSTFWNVQEWPLLQFFSSSVRNFMEIFFHMAFHRRCQPCLSSSQTPPVIRSERSLPSVTGQEQIQNLGSSQL